MKILFSPSEAKTAAKGDFVDFSGRFSSQNYADFKQTQHKVLKIYEDFLNAASEAQLAQVFGLKNQAQIAAQKEAFFAQNAGAKAVLRYDGVAYNALSYRTLPAAAQRWIDENCLIFSNLYGVNFAGEGVKNYKIKQGEALPSSLKNGHFSGLIRTEELYKPALGAFLNELLAGEEILDLRAGFYDKFFTPTQPHTTLKFVKNGKVISHFAKHYRGIALRYAALAFSKNGAPQRPTIADFLNLNIPNLSVNLIKTVKNKTEITIEISD